VVVVLHCKEVGARTWGVSMDQKCSVMGGDEEMVVRAGGGGWWEVGGG
jgi:hypothetical protein